MPVPRRHPSVRRLILHANDGSQSCYMVLDFDSRVRYYLLLHQLHLNHDH